MMRRLQQIVAQEQKVEPHQHPNTSQSESESLLLSAEENIFNKNSATRKKETAGGRKRERNATNHHHHHNCKHKNITLAVREVSERSLGDIRQGLIQLRWLTLFQDEEKEKDGTAERTETEHLLRSVLEKSKLNLLEPDASFNRHPNNNSNTSQKADVHVISSTDSEDEDTKPNKKAKLETKLAKPPSSSLSIEDLLEGGLTPSSSSAPERKKLKHVVVGYRDTLLNLSHAVGRLLTQQYTLKEVLTYNISQHTAPQFYKILEYAIQNLYLYFGEESSTSLAAYDRCLLEGSVADASRGNLSSHTNLWTTSGRQEEEELVSIPSQLAYMSLVVFDLNYRYQHPHVSYASDNNQIIIIRMVIRNRVVYSC
ncbi:hypothetical protein ADEAN_000564400 [Angomonas deanei]|uniref:Uncharacterized protein n=1 Tax=Angomonas deanei TaxID=59799 RepID=A0A7G2CGJ2_9TRYP|nr:hypothetical protein ADEAN_000564400 [Angomonas deanei]